MEVGETVTLGSVTGKIVQIQDLGNMRRVTLQVNENKMAVVTLERGAPGLDQMRLG